MNTGKIYDLDRIRSIVYDSKTQSVRKNYFKYYRFFKTKEIDYYDEELAKSLKKVLVVVYGVELEEIGYLRRKNQIENIVKSINKNIYQHFDDVDYCCQYLKKYECFVDINNDIPKGSPIIGTYSIKNKVMNNMDLFNGYYGFIMDVDVVVPDTIREQVTKFLNDYQFSVVPKDFSTMPKYVKYEDRLKAHFLISYLTLVILRYLMKKSNYKFTYYHIFETLKDLNFLKVDNEGWIPVFDINEITPYMQKLIDNNIIKNLYLLI